MRPASARIASAATCWTCPPAHPNHQAVECRRRRRERSSRRRGPSPEHRGRARCEARRATRSELSTLNRNVGGPADLEGGQRRKRRVTFDARRQTDRRSRLGTAVIPAAPTGGARAAVSASSASRAGARNEANPVAWRELACQRQVGGDHGRNLRVSAGRLAVGHQQDRLARLRHLHRADRRRVREDVAAVCVPQGGPSSRNPMRLDCVVTVKRRGEQLSSASAVNIASCGPAIARRRAPPSRQGQRLARGLWRERSVAGGRSGSEVAGDERPSAERSHAAEEARGAAAEHAAARRSRHERPASRARRPALRAEAQRWPRSRRGMARACIRRAASTDSSNRAPVTAQSRSPAASSSGRRA